VFFFARTFFHTGPDAVAQMDPSELVLLAKIEQIKPGMSRQDVVRVLGEPDEDKIFRLEWLVNRNPLNGVAIDFYPGVRRVRWASLGRFLYEKQL
jgi:hypothetical protein